MTREVATLENGYTDSMTCVCGNTCSDSGLPYSDENGVVMHLSKGEVPAGLAEMPEDGSNCFILCPSCGRLYKESAATETEIPVFKTVDLSSPEIVEAFRIHDILMSGESLV